MTGRPVKMAMVGVSGWGGVVVQKASECPNIQVTGFYDANPDEAAKAAKQYGGTAYTRLQDLLANAEIEAVSLVTPNDTHRPLTEQIAAAGKHVLVEKPLANTTAEAEAMIRVCRKAGVLLAVGHQSRRFGGHRKLKALAGAGALGQVVMAEAHFGWAAAWNLTPQHWRYHRARCPLGPYNLLAVHHLDTLQYLFGGIEAVMGMAVADVAPSTAEDCVTSLLAFRSGICGYLGASYVTPHAYYIFLHGTQASARCWDGGDVELIPVQGDAETLCVEKGDASLEQLENFAAAVRGLAEYEVPGTTAYEAVAVMEALDESLQTGRRQTVRHWAE